MNAASPESQQMPPQAVLMQMAMGYMVSQALSVSAKMKIADLLATGAMTAEEIAERTQSHAPSVFRLMRALASVGVFDQSDDDVFSNTPFSRFLRSDHPESLRVIVEMIGSFEHWNAHGNMFHSVKTGGIAFDHTFGMPVFPFFAANPKSAELFDAAMTSFSLGIANAVVVSYDFSAAGTIADIGGGHGILLSKVLDVNSNAKGILFDQPQVVAGASPSDRIDAVGGDFFSEIPVVADVYLMKFILHDWNDEQSISILSNLAKHAPQGAKVLLVETVIEEENVPSMSKVMDLNMLVMTGGKERTASEYSELFEKTGFRLERVIPMPAPVQIVEAVRV